MSRDSVSKTFTVAGALCIVCSVLVSTAAVTLKGRQDQNKVLDRQKNILVSAGLYDDEDPVDITETYDANIVERVIDLDTGDFVDLDPADFDQRKAIKDPAQSEAVSEGDIAKIKRREKHSLVYLYSKDGVLQQVILPVRGMGLWGTLWGFLAVDPTGEIIQGLTYYEHKETPGLGGEVDNPRWKAQWVGKRIYDAEGAIKVKVKKGIVDATRPEEKDHQVDGLAGATITANGVTNMMQYWLGENGFGPFLVKVRAGEIVGTE